MRWPRLIVVALVDLEPRAVLEAVHRPLDPVRADDHDRDVAAHDDQLAIGVAGDVAVAHPHRAFEIRLDEGLVGDLGRAADVEGAHRELRAGLADRLRRDDADRLAMIDRRAAGEIAPVAGGADAVLRLADEHRTDLHLLDAGGRDRLDVLLLDHRVRRARSRCRLASTRSSAVERPRMREASEATTWPASMMARILMPRSVPQSGSRMTASCATSTRRRVR